MSPTPERHPKCPDGILLADYPKYPLPDDRLNGLIENSMDWAHGNGLVMRTAEQKDRSDLCQSAPFALLPSPFPRKLYQQAVDAQNLIAALYHEIAYDFDFLIKTHENVVKTDDFTMRLINILKTVKEEGISQPISLTIQRSDYMCHKDPFTCEYALKQIEVNNIASSMGAHAERVSKMHRRNMLLLGYDSEFVNKAIPSNNPIAATVAEGLFKAWKLYDDQEAIIAIVVEEVNQNQLDQRHIEYELERLGVPIGQIVRFTMAQCAEQLTLSNDRKLVYKGGNVAVVYYRAGYDPAHYHSEKEWEARLLVERSTAIKSPWIGAHLAGTKKTQQVLAEDGVVERYVGSPREAAAIRNTFAGLWSIDSSDPITQKLIQSAIAHPDRFVLKPQLEGGAGNYYGKDVADKLTSMTSDERAAHILMERVQPMTLDNYLVRSLQPTILAKCVSELGIYGYSLGGKDSPLLKQGGHLLRTKGEKVDAGGVAVGASVIDSPFLFEML